LNYSLDIFDHRDISFFSLFHNSGIYFMINIYLDEQQLALKYLRDTEVNIHNILIITWDFNIRDRDRDLAYPHYLVHSNTFTYIADSFELRLFFPVHQVLMRYTNNHSNSNSIINLMFLQLDSIKFNNHLILPES